MTRGWLGRSVGLWTLCVALGGCSGSGGTAHTSFTPMAMPDDLPPAGTADSVDIPVTALPADTSTPTTVVGSGTPETCTSQAFLDAVATGGAITFNCGAAPKTIELTATAEINNLGAHEIVIDGGGLVTLSGRGTPPPASPSRT